MTDIISISSAFFCCVPSTLLFSSIPNRTVFVVGFWSSIFFECFVDVGFFSYFVSGKSFFFFQLGPKQSIFFFSSSHYIFFFCVVVIILLSWLKTQKQCYLTHFPYSLLGAHVVTLDKKRLSLYIRLLYWLF